MGAAGFACYSYPRMDWLHVNRLGWGALTLIVAIALLLPSATAVTVEADDCCQRTVQGAIATDPGAGAIPTGQDAPSTDDGCTTDCAADCCTAADVVPVAATAMPTAPPSRIGSAILTSAADYTPERPLPPPRIQG